MLVSGPFVQSPGMPCFSGRGQQVTILDVLEAILEEKPRTGDLREIRQQVSRIRRSGGTIDLTSLEPKDVFSYDVPISVQNHRLFPLKSVQISPVDMSQAPASNRSSFVWVTGSNPLCTDDYILTWQDAVGRNHAGIKLWKVTDIAGNGTSSKVNLVLIESQYISKNRLRKDYIWGGF